MMKLFPWNKKRPEKEPEVGTGQDEEYGFFILHNLPDDQANALECVL